MKLSVIIPCYNAAPYIATQLEALARQQWSEPWEVIVADNGSTDDSRAIVERYRGRLPNLRVVDASDKRGAAHASNVGALAAAGEALAFCDADDEVGEGWLAAMGAGLARHDFIACRYAADRLNPAWVQAIHRVPQRDGLQVYDEPPYLPHAGGSSLGVKRSVHLAVGGFDESLMQLQDTDYCWRIQLSGTELHFCPEALVHIRYRHTLGGIFRQAAGYAEYNVLLYKRYRARGMPELSWKSALPEWLYVLRLVPGLRSRRDVARWLWQLGWRIGRLRGSLKHRVLAP